jgi:hypothetical protein
MNEIVVTNETLSEVLATLSGRTITAYSATKRMPRRSSPQIDGLEESIQALVNGMVYTFPLGMVYQLVTERLRQIPTNLFIFLYRNVQQRA